MFIIKSCIILLICCVCFINAQTCFLPTCCNLTMRNTIDPTTKFPKCIIVGIIKDQGDEDRYFTKELPLSVWTASVRGSPGLSATPVFYLQTNNTYDSGLDGLRNNDYDVYIADIWALSRRAIGVDWSIGYTREFIGIGFLVSVRAESSFLALFDPFQGIIWGLAVLLLIFGGVLLFIVEWLHPISDDVPPPGGRLVYRFAFWRSVLRAFDNSFMSPFAAGRFTPKSPAGQFIIFGLKFFFLILLESYVANLASFLTISGANTKISLDKILSQGILSPQNANVDYAQAAGGKIIDVPDTPTPAMLRTIMSGANPNKILSYVSGSGALLNAVDKNCDARFLRLPFSVDTTLSFREHPAVATVRRAVDVMTLTLRQNGTMQTMVDQTYLPEAKRCPNSRFSADERVVDPSTLQLGVDNMQGLFVITIGICAVAILLAIILRFISQILYGAYSAEMMWQAAKPMLSEISEEPSGIELRKDPQGWKTERIRKREDKVK